MKKVAYNGEINRDLSLHKIRIKTGPPKKVLSSDKFENKMFLDSLEKVSKDKKVVKYFQKNKNQQKKFSPIENENNFRTLET